MDLSSLEAHLAEAKARFVPSHTNPDWDTSEDKAWAVQEYLSHKGELSDADRQYLRDTDPELLKLEDEEQ